MNVYFKQLKLVNSEKTFHFLLLIQFCQQCSYYIVCYCLSSFYLKKKKINSETSLSIDLMKKIKTQNLCDQIVMN